MSTRFKLRTATRSVHRSLSMPRSRTRNPRSSQTLLWHSDFLAECADVEARTSFRRASLDLVPTSWPKAAEHSELKLPVVLDRFRSRVHPGTSICAAQQPVRFLITAYVLCLRVPSQRPPHLHGNIRQDATRS